MIFEFLNFWIFSKSEFFKAIVVKNGDTTIFQSRVTLSCHSNSPYFP